MRGLTASVLALLAACSSSAPPIDAAPRLERLNRPDAGERRELGGADQRRPDTRPAPPARWDPTTAMGAARSRFTATLLADGTVLVVGGYAQKDATQPFAGLKSAERYDPQTGAWTAAGAMSQGHWAHQAVRLLDGRVLVTGGCDGVDSFVCMTGVGAELFDPQTGAWSATPLPTSRRAHTMTLLADGRVLVAGGYNISGSLTSLEIFDPQTKLWSSPSSALNVKRASLTATTLKNGQVLLVGGTDGGKALDTLELHDPQTGLTKLLAPRLKTPREMHTATRLLDGRVLLVGGLCDELVPPCSAPEAEVYDPASDKLFPAGAQSQLIFHTTTLLADGRALIVGGDSNQGRVALLWDPTTMSLIQTLPATTSRHSHVAVFVGAGVLVVGGMDYLTDAPLASAEIYTP